MMLLLMEVANLGNAISDHELKKVQSLDSYESTQSELRKSPNANDNKLQDELRSTNMISVFSPTISVFKKGELMSSYSFSDEEGSPLDAPCKNRSEENETMKKSASNEINLDQLSSALTDDDEDDSPIQHTKNGEIIVTQPIEPPISSVDDPVSGMLYDASTTARISSLLDGWEEPVNKADKMVSSIILCLFIFFLLLTHRSHVLHTFLFVSLYRPILQSMRYCNLEKRWNSLMIHTHLVRRLVLRSQENRASNQQRVYTNVCLHCHPAPVLYILM